ncbi:hypothetical protein [Roseinatronobacter alkalisoli]|uniref:Uncharacterized protein n=1 Tax=Roseinatronobacter alkalisoli TaxID=3028235 RepID=A0ABT5TFA7_9RHOB|nr:hypothetical protein [Roseinatronobacter sp. HJB301]MDD7973799.1 hypothetical protein [Roseinatronobacter sp. HJB301]
MRSYRAISVLGLLVALGFLLMAYRGLGLGSTMQMERLGVVIYVTAEVVERGGVVSILTRKVPVDEFEARYPVPETPTEIVGAPRAARQWYGTVNGAVNMVYFEIPDDGSYTYRFRSVPRDGVAEVDVPERVLTIGGISYDADGQDSSYFDFGLIRAHEIAQLDSARAWIPRPGAYTDEDLVCQDGYGVRVCVPTEDGLKARAEYLTKSSPGIRGKTPWEP